MMPVGFQPIISVAIPVHNGARHLAEAVGSVLDQTERDFELVLFDNASTDSSLSVMRSIRDPRVRIEVTGRPLPPATAMSAAVQLCRGELVKVLQPGDVLHPRCLEIQGQSMLDDPGLALVASRRHVMDSLSRVVVPGQGLRGLVGIHSGIDVARRIVRRRTNLIGDPCNVMFRRETFMAVGGWRGDQRRLMNLDCWMRLLQSGDFFGRAEPLAAVRIGGSANAPGYVERVREEHVAINEAIKESDSFEARGIDRAMGGFLAPMGGLRRGALSAMSRTCAKRERRAAKKAARA